jgi:hypothetical protein
VGEASECGRERWHHPMLPEKSIDGIVGPGTWSRMAGLGEAMASIATVLSPDAQRLCYKGSEERINRGYRMATGRGFELPEDATASVFNAILATMPGRMKDVELQYRGTGAAGALVYSGLGEFVPRADIFKGGLRPGAAMQVWKHKDAYDLLRAGEITEGDANFYGTSFVFIRYDTDTNERILVRHFSGTEWHTQADFDVWVRRTPSSGRDRPCRPRPRRRSARHSPSPSSAARSPATVPQPHAAGEGRAARRPHLLPLQGRQRVRLSAG